MDYPEFNSVEKFKKAVSVFENTESILPLVKSGSDLEISINVGSDDTGLEDCSVITVSCNIYGDTKLTAGVIGQMRMDYPKAISVLKEVAQTIENSINNEGEE